MMPRGERHVLGLSGGRDSAALAVYMRSYHPHLDITYFFTDTGKELAFAKAHDDEVTAVVLSADGRRCLSGSRDGLALAWQIVEK